MATFATTKHYCLFHILSISAIVVEIIVLAVMYFDLLGAKHRRTHWVSHLRNLAPIFWGVYQRREMLVFFLNTTT